MAKQRKILVYIATSADGFIARPGGKSIGSTPATLAITAGGAFFKTVEASLWVARLMGSWRCRTLGKSAPVYRPSKHSSEGEYTHGHRRHTVL